MSRSKRAAAIEATARLNAPNRHNSTTFFIENNNSDDAASNDSFDDTHSISDGESSDSEISDEDMDVDGDPDGWRILSDDEFVNDREIPFRGRPNGISQDGQVDYDNFSPTDFADLFITDDLIRLLVQWTNARAEEHLSDLRNGNQQRRIPADAEKASAFERKWKDVTVEKLKSFLSCLFLMGIIKKPTLRMYWSKDHIWSTPIFGERGTLSRDDFLQILRFIRFSDPAAFDGNDKRSRIQQFIEEMNRICLHTFNPDKHLSVDLSKLLLWKGRLRFRQYIRTKRARFGIKFFMINDTNGYMVSSVIYVGQEHQEEWAAHLTDIDSLTSSGRIVVHMLQLADALDRGYYVYVDNFTGSTVYLYRSTCESIKLWRQELFVKIVESRIT